jgi:hypothetical protein
VGATGIAEREENLKTVLPMCGTSVHVQTSAILFYTLRSYASYGDCFPELL